jgi:hypothetical protein
MWIEEGHKKKQGVTAARSRKSMMPDSGIAASVGRIFLWSFIFPHNVKTLFAIMSLKTNLAPGRLAAHELDVIDHDQR